MSCQVMNEAYTSVASFIDQDSFHQKEFSGRRIKRGLYQVKKAF